MKKFLSVLLALAVAFTFTFGSTMSAFAAVTVSDLVTEKVTEEQGDLAKIAEDALKTIVYTQDGYVVTVNGGTPTNCKLVSKAVIEELSVAQVAKYKNEISKAGTEEIVADVYNATAIENAWADVDTISEYLAVLLASDCKDALAKQFVIEKNAVAAKLAAVDYSLYSELDYTDDNTANSNRDNVKAIVSNGTNGLALISITDTTAAADIATAIGNVKNVWTTAETAINGINTIAEENKALSTAKTNAKVNLQSKAATLKTTIKGVLEETKNSATSTPTQVADATAKLNSLDADFDKVSTFFENAINAVVIDKDVDPATAVTKVESVTTKVDTAYATQSAFYLQLDKMSSTDSLIAYAKSYAAAKIAEVNTNGTLVYNAATVEDRLEVVIEGINALTYTTNAQVAGAFNGMTTALEEAEALAGAKSDAIAAITTGNYASTNWTDARKDKVEAIQENAKKAINAATTLKEVKAAKEAAMNEMDGILSSEQIGELDSAILSQLNTVLGYATSKAGTGGSLEAYADGFFAKNGATNYRASAKADALSDAVELLYEAVYAKENKDITLPEIKAILVANYSAALAVIDAIQPTTALEEAEAAVIAKIAAIDKTVTLDSKAVALEAQSALEEYMEMPGHDISKITNSGILTAAMTKLISLTRTDVTNQISTLNAKTAITVEDAAAVEAARAAYDAYKADYSDYDVDGTYNYGYTRIADTNIVAVEGRLASARLADAAKKINALPSPITADDAAAVEAARTAYNALTDAQKAAFSPLLLQKLEAAEATIATLTKYDNQDAKADLLDMSRKLTIWRTSKTSIKVTAVGSVKNIKANGYTVKYSFYKKAPGATSYKLMKTTTSNKYTYTNLKKGTNKFQIKVKVYDADGKLVATKMTYYRAAKVK